MVLGQDLLSFCLRVGELAFACVVAGLTGEYLHSVEHVSTGTKGRFIYTEVIAAISILLALLWLLPFSGGFIHWPIDLFLFAAWIVSFALMVNFLGDSCGSTFDWSNNFGSGQCQHFKADEAFAFLSAIFWLVSALVGIYYVHRHRTTATTTTGTHTNTRRGAWYRRQRI